MAKQSVRVLLVEDNPEDAQVIEEVLTEETDTLFDVTWANSLAAGLKVFEQGKVEVVLLDLKLPDSQGLDTLAKMCQQEPDVPIVILTASDDEWMASQALQHGAQDYLVKGYVQVYPNLLQRAMRYAMERKHTDATHKKTQSEAECFKNDIRQLQREVDALLHERGRPPKYGT